MIHFENLYVAGGILAGVLFLVSLWTRRQRARAHALATAGRAEDAQALLDRLEAITPIVVIGSVTVATMFLVVR